MKKIILGFGLATLIIGSASAMEMMASTTMMKKDEVMHDMKATGTVMKHSDMLMEIKDIKKDMMMKCLDIRKATRMEIKKFQKENGLDQAGVIGKKTKAKLAKMGCMKEMKGEMMDMKKEMMMKKMDDKMMKASGTGMIN